MGQKSLPRDFLGRHTGKNRLTVGPRKELGKNCLEEKER